MTVVLGAWIGAVACLGMLGVLAVIAQLSANETPDFVYLVGVGLAVAAWIFLSKAGF